MLIFQCHFDGPSAEIPEANEAPLKPMGPLEFMGPHIIVPPAPLSAALLMRVQW